MCIQQKKSTQLLRIGPAVVSPMQNKVLIKDDLSFSWETSDETESSPSSFSTVDATKDTTTNGPITPESVLRPVYLSMGSRKSRRSSKKMTKKSVCFQDDVTYRPVLHIADYKAGEIANTWYTPKEYDGIKADILKTLGLMKSGSFVEDGEASTKKVKKHKKNSKKILNCSSRGLENYTSKGSLRESVRSERQNAVWAVLDEQDAQVERAESMGMTYLVYDHVAFRVVYKRLTKGSIQNARLHGKFDATAAAAPVPEESTGEVVSPKTSPKKTIKKLLFRKSPSSSKPRWFSSRKCSPELIKVAAPAAVPVMHSLAN
eukprot:CAMPEP_0201124724 /NCGR_PEP_ID=MMETSP0850-20130426/16810_1 /ASSEMBLY_ACC=CAM_ASM_000622 /TAXON_ID=183588 /ORGANISM="Pseudo-nitzschia fraudulenta, Strain WWA7" /LENGTH=316 /DNA_ID=CAMNT_0047392319 /DNA_START=24 /DNA_END=974 /DNA_ORIENTATION=+